MDVVHVICALILDGSDMQSKINLSFIHILISKSELKKIAKRKKEMRR